MSHPHFYVPYNAQKIRFMLKQLVYTALTATIFTGAAHAQSFNKAKMDSLMDAISSHNKGMGSLALSSNGQVIYARAIGYSNLETKTPADEHTKYRIGSITKVFTSVMIFQLIEEGKLSLTTPLSKYYPAVPKASGIKITDLLNHHSGIHNFTSDSTYLQWNTKPHTQQQILDIIIKGGSDFTPGSRGEYSNSNYVLLGWIIEKVTGDTYASQLKKRITSRLALKDTYYGGKVNTAGNEAHSYSFMTSWQLEDETDMSVPGGAGSIVSTPSDLNTFITALFHGKLISKASLDEMISIKDGFGKGIFRVPFGLKHGYGHTGGIDGFSSSMGYFPSDSVAVSYINNGQVISTNDIMIGALSIYFNKPYKIPDFKIIEVSEAILKGYTGVYASAQMPLKITITLKDKILFAQATGQGQFPLEAKDPQTFEFASAGIEMKFDSQNNQMILNQGGGKYTFTREKK